MPEVGSAEVGIPEADLAAVVSPTPGIPCFGSLFQDAKLLLVGHGALLGLVQAGRRAGSAASS